MNDQTFNAPRCKYCGQPNQPRLIEVTAMGDNTPRWLLNWNCGTATKCTAETAKK